MTSITPCRLLALPGAGRASIGWAIAVLSWAGHRVDRADTSESALQMLGSVRYDVLLLGYGSSPEDMQLAVDLLQDPDTRIPTLILLSHEEEFVNPPQTHFVPTAFLEPGFNSKDLLDIVDKLRQFRK